MKRGDLGDSPRLRRAAGFLMRGVDYGIYPAEGAGDHGGGGVPPWQHSRGRDAGEPGSGKWGGGTTPGEVKLESRLSHTVGRGTPIFPKPPEILSMS